MDTNEVERGILRRLYHVWAEGSDRPSMHEIRAEVGAADTPFWNLADEMTEKGLIRARTMGGYYDIATEGILRAEREEIAPPEQAHTNNRIREGILVELASVRDAQGSLATAHYEHLAQSTASSANDVIRNAKVLEDLGLIEFSSAGSFKITMSGLEVARRLTTFSAIGQEFDEIATMAPHPRGRALQSLLARLVALQGWNEEEGTRTANEEIDVVFSRGREYFLLESKWEQDRVEASTIREFYGKLANRVDVRGVVASMSGFTSGAINQTLTYASSKLILLFGHGDLDALLHGRESLDEMLDEKYRALVTLREIRVR